MSYRANINNKINRRYSEENHHKALASECGNIGIVIPRQDGKSSHYEGQQYP